MPRTRRRALVSASPDTSAKTSRASAKTSRASSATKKPARVTEPTSPRSSTTVPPSSPPIGASIIIKAAAEAERRVLSRMTRRSTEASPSKEARSTSTSSTKTARSTRRGAVAAAKSPSPVPEEEFRSVTPSTIIPSTPGERGEHESSPAQSSNAENRSPGNLRLSIPSSPPIAHSTPKGRGRLILDYGSDSGYTPPPPNRAKLGSAERPRLQDLDPRTLGPIGTGDEDEEDRQSSPTPRKPHGSFVMEEEEGEDDIIAAISLPPLRKELERPAGGHAFHIGSQEFMIYSDPKSKSSTPDQETPKATQNEFNRPPLSVSSSPSPDRKRRSSDAGLDGEAGLTAVEATAPKKRSRRAAKTTKTAAKGTRPKATRSQKNKSSTTTLRDLLPPRKKTKKSRDILEFPASEEEGEEDHLTKSRKTKASAAAKRTADKGKKTANAKGKSAKTTQTKAPTGVKETPVRTYTKKALDNSANEPIADGNDDGNDAGRSGLSEQPSDSTCSGSVHVHLVTDKEARHKLKELRKKFREVDQWPLEFEDVSVPSSEAEKR